MSRGTEKAEKKSFFFKTFGCKVNRYDGQVIVEELERAGWRAAARPDEAGLVVINCCTVTARSAGRCRRFVRGAARRSPDAPVLVTGCQTRDDARAFAAMDPRIRVVPRGEGPAVVRGIAGGRGSARGVAGLKDRTRAYVKVQDGCDLACTYCIIPSIRGPSRSRPVGEILAEVEVLLDRGYRELVLCGIRLGGYRDGGTDLAGLVERILAAARGAFRLRLSSLNPAEVTEGLLAAMAGDDRVAPHLHLPLQSGDDETLRRMARPYKVSAFLEKAEGIRRVLREPALTTDFMVGFPGEDEASFARSLETLRAMRPARVHVFPYSARGGTKAAVMAQIEERVKTARAAEARRLAEELKEEYDKTFLGGETEVLVEGRGPGAAGLTPRYQKVEILEKGDPSSGPSPFERPGAGDFVPVRLEKYARGLFTGRIRAPGGRGTGGATGTEGTPGRGAGNAGRRKEE